MKYNKRILTKQPKQMTNHPTGNSINVFNLNELIENIKTLDKYTPSKLALQLPQLQQLYNKGTWHLEEVLKKKNTWSICVDTRQERYKSLGAFCSRIVGIMSGTNASPADIENAKSIVKKLKGIRLHKPNKKDIPNPEDPEANKERSISRASFDSMYECFADLVSLLSMTEGYEPLNPEFTLEALELLKDQLLQANFSIDTAIANINAARISRNEFLYTEETGLVDIALHAKKYIKGVYGATSLEFKDINKIRFKNFR